MQSNRRQMIRSIAGGSLLLPGIMSQLMSDSANAAKSNNPLSPKDSHFPATAKRIIFLFMTGGVSHVDTFDHKPILNERHDQQQRPRNFYKGSGWKFRKYGESGMEISDLFPHIGSVADEICMINSMKNINGDHFGATIGIHTGSATFNRPSFGSWVSYGLGTVNQNLPSFVVVSEGIPYGGGQNWGSDFLPVLHQGTQIGPGNDPIKNIRPAGDSGKLQKAELDLVEFFNKQHLKGREADSNLASRVRSFETAAGMQLAAPEAFDLSNETQETLDLYGLEPGQTTSFGWQCLVARRLAQRGVRFIELVDGDTFLDRNWDAHANISKYPKLSKNVDQPIAALIKDLKRLGMLDDTLVVFTTEFGRGPFVPEPGTNGRGHHASAYSSWIAGGGIKGGLVYGKSDEFGSQVAENVVSPHDFHATLLHCLGMDHEKLTYRHAGRDYRLTDVHGDVLHDILKS